MAKAVEPKITAEPLGLRLEILRPHPHCYVRLSKPTMEHALAVITITTFVKDLVELGRKIKDSIDQVRITLTSTYNILSDDRSARIKSNSRNSGMK
jgi:hypothetical protein